MKKGVAHLVPFIDRLAEKNKNKEPKARILLATVKGDVHDIGKNIVGVVLGCNNYDVIDLGVMVPAERILEEAQKNNVQMIGLSGLITPSLDEMVYVADEMKREKFDIPLLIGGATTSRLHTAVKIEPSYNHPVIHVNDASKSVTVVNKLVSKTLKDDFTNEIRNEYVELREKYNSRDTKKSYLTIEEARKNKTPINWKETEVRKPDKPGIHTFRNFPIGDLKKYIDWGPFFIAWEMKGKYPAILDDPKAGGEARKLFDDANELLDKIICDGLLTAHGVAGLFPANSAGDDIEVYTDESRKEVLVTLHTLRQQAKKRKGEPNKALADYIAPKETGMQDYIGGFAVTAGHGLKELAERYEADHDDYNSILLKSIGDRLAEAFAEYLHEKVRKELWGFAPDEDFDNSDLIREKYTGIRPAPGYPAQPDHTEKPPLFDLLSAQKYTGITLTESYAMNPAASVSGLFFSHPESQYFNLGKIQRDQVEDYAHRKGMSVKEAERWLGPNLAY